MAFLQKRDKVPIILSAEQAPPEWFLEVKDLSNPKYKDYMDNEVRTKALHGMVTNMVKEVQKSRQQTGSG